MDDAIAARLAELGISAARLAARGLQPYAEAAAEQLVLADVNDAGREFHLLPGAATAWQAMRDAAAADGVTLFLVSAFRSVARQHEIVAAKLARGQSLDAILAVSAAPASASTIPAVPSISAPPARRCWNNTLKPPRPLPGCSNVRPTMVLP